MTKKICHFDVETWYDFREFGKKIPETQFPKLPIQHTLNELRKIAKRSSANGIRVHLIRRYE